jgi:hypothetical protein
MSFLSELRVAILHLEEITQSRDYIDHISGRRQLSDLRGYVQIVPSLTAYHGVGDIIIMFILEDPIKWKPFSFKRLCRKQHQRSITARCNPLIVLFLVPQLW